MFHHGTFVGYEFVPLDPIYGELLYPDCPVHGSVMSSAGSSGVSPVLVVRPTVHANMVL